MTLLLGCCTNEALQPTQRPNGANQFSIEIAVDQRQHIGKAAKLAPNSFRLSSEWHHLSKDKSNICPEG
jgi:hypothetical protein